MTGTNFTTSFLTDNKPQEVYDAINNVRGWWQGEIEGGTDQLNDEFNYRMKEHHFSRQKVAELIPGKKVVWLITDSKLNALTDQSEWTGTTIVFDISEVNNKTQVTFTHEGLVPAIECYNRCSGGWEALIQKSLFSLVTTGKGANVFG